MLDPLGFAFASGVLSILSPCILPLLPIVLGTALSKHRYGPLALALGLATSFIVIGLFVALVGFSIGLDAPVFRSAGALLLIGVGLATASTPVRVRIAVAGGPVADWSHRHFRGLAGAGFTGQFGVGLLLGMVWSPCAGPTLGAASVMAAEAHDLAGVTLTMLLFGIGAALPLIVCGGLAREAMARWRHRLVSAGESARVALGVALMIVGLGVVTGLDRTVEARLVGASPPWLITLTSRF